MNKKIIIFKIYFAFMSIFSMLLASKNLFAQEENSDKNLAKQSKNVSDIYSFSFEEFSGKPISLSEYKGKVLLVVNTASKCGFTGQYEGLEKLYKKYKDRGLVVIAVPSNDFGSQEPEGDQEIQRFCKFNYGVSFPVARKEIVSGEKAHPFYKWAQNELGVASSPKWNFHKYLINREGRMVDYFISSTTPESDKIIASIEKLL